MRAALVLGAAIFCRRVSVAERALEDVEVLRVARAAVDGKFNYLESVKVARHDSCRSRRHDRWVVAERAASESAEYYRLLSFRRGNVEDSPEATFVQCAEPVWRNLNTPVAIPAVHAVARTLAKIRRRA